MVFSGLKKYIGTTLTTYNGSRYHEVGMIYGMRWLVKTIAYVKWSTVRFTVFDTYTLVYRPGDPPDGMKTVPLVVEK